MQAGGTDEGSTSEGCGARRREEEACTREQGNATPRDAQGDEREHAPTALACARADAGVLRTLAAQGVALVAVAIKELEQEGAGLRQREERERLGLAARESARAEELQAVLHGERARAEAARCKAEEERLHRCAAVDKIQDINAALMESQRAAQDLQARVEAVTRENDSLRLASECAAAYAAQARTAREELLNVTTALEQMQQRTAVLERDKELLTQEMAAVETLMQEQLRLEAASLQQCERKLHACQDQLLQSESGKAAMEASLRAEGAALKHERDAAVVHAAGLSERLAAERFPRGPAPTPDSLTAAGARGARGSVRDDDRRHDLAPVPDLAAVDFRQPRLHGVVHGTRDHQGQALSPPLPCTGRSDGPASTPAAVKAAAAAAMRNSSRLGPGGLLGAVHGGHNDGAAGAAGASVKPRAAMSDTPAGLPLLGAVPGGRHDGATGTGAAVKTRGAMRDMRHTPATPVLLHAGLPLEERRGPEQVAEVQCSGSPSPGVPKGDAAAWRDRWRTAVGAPPSTSHLDRLQRAE